MFTILPVFPVFTMFTCHSLSWLVTLCLNSGQESGDTQVREQEACQGYLQVSCSVLLVVNMIKYQMPQTRRQGNSLTSFKHKLTAFWQKL